MCKEQKLYKLVYCCEWFEEYFRLTKGKKWYPCTGVTIKENKIFLECQACQEERREALSDDYSKDE